MVETPHLKEGLKSSMIVNGALCVMMTGTSQTLTLCANNSASVEQLMHGSLHTLVRDAVKLSWTTSTAQEKRKDCKIVFSEAGVSATVSIQAMLL